MVGARLQALQYITGALLVVLVAWHLAMRIPELRGLQSFTETLLPQVVYGEHTSYGALLLLLALAALFHGVNGLRIILLELHHGPIWDKLVNAAAVLAFLAMAAVAVHSVLYVPPP